MPDPQTPDTTAVLLVDGLPAGSLKLVPSRSAPIGGGSGDPQTPDTSIEILVDGYPLSTANPLPSLMTLTAISGITATDLQGILEELAAKYYTQNELAYAEKTDGTQSSIGSATDITSLSAISFDVVAGQVVYVEVVCPWTTSAAAGNSLALYVTDASNNIKATAVGPRGTAAAGTCGALRCVERITAAGSYTRKGRVQGLVGNMSILSGATSPSPVYIRAYREK